MGFMDLFRRKNKGGKKEENRDPKKSKKSDQIGRNPRALDFEGRKETFIDLPLGLPRDVWRIIFGYLRVSHLAQLSSTCILLFDVVQRYVGPIKSISLRESVKKCLYDLDLSECKRFQLNEKCEEDKQLILDQGGANETSWLDKRTDINKLELVSGLNRYVSLTSHFSSLTSLRLEGVHVKQESIQTIFFNERLKELSIKHSDLSDESWKALSQCCSRSLTSLDLCTDIPAEALRLILDKCLNLKHFKFESVKWFFYPWQLRGIWFHQLGNEHPKLESVYLKGLHFSSLDFRQFENCKNLKRLHITNPFGVEPGALAELLKCAKNWKELECLECFHFMVLNTSEEWEELMENFPKLVKLAWDFKSIEEFGALCNKPNNIEHFEVQIDQKGKHALGEMWKAFSKVTDLDYSGPMWDLPTALQKYLPNLRNLSVKWIGDADKGIDRFTKEIPELQRVNVTDYREKIQAVKHTHGFSSFRAPFW